MKGTRALRLLAFIYARSVFGKHFASRPPLSGLVHFESTPPVPVLPKMAVESARIVRKEPTRFVPEDGRLDKYTLADALPAKLSELGLRPRSMTERPAYSVRLITCDDKDKVLDFLKRFFFIDEPLNQAVNLLETPESRCLELEEYATSTLDQNVSVAAVDDNDEFVGIIINGLVRREDTVDASPKVEECPNPKFRKILRVLSYLDQEARIWEKLPKDCKRVLEIRIASTHSDWRGQGLMKVLCEETERIARENGAGALRVDTTSAYSAAAADRLGYQRVFNVEYAALADAPRPDPPHTAASVYIKRTYNP